MLVNTSPVEAEINIDVSVAEFEADLFGALLEFVYTGHITIVATQVRSAHSHAMAQCAIACNGHILKKKHL